MFTQEQAILALVGQYERLKAERYMRMTRVEAMRKYTFPHKSYLTSPMSPGTNAWSAIFDNTGQAAAAEFAANFFTEATPSDQKWFLLSPPAGDPELANDRGYAQGLAERTERVHMAMAKTESLWTTEIQSALEDWTDGTCCLEFYKERNPRSPNAFLVTALGMNEFCFLTDAAGRPHTVFSEQALTAAEAAERFGKEALTDAQQKGLVELSDTAYIETSPFLNVMRPRTQWDPSALGPSRFRYDNLWIDMKTKKLLKREGMRRLRRIVCRFRAGRGLPWGFGPTDAAYGAIRGLDKAIEIWLKYGAMKMNPPSIWPDDGAFWPQDATPGAVIVGRMGATDKGRPEFLEVQGDHRVGEFLVTYLSRMISRVFLAEVFEILRDTKQRTAREVAMILQKSYGPVIPPLARIKQELLSPSILIALELQTEKDLGIDGWMYGGRTLPEFRYDLEVISPLYLAMKFNELQRMDDLVTMNSRLAEIDPSVWDEYSLTDMSRAIGDNLGVPVRWKRSQSALRQIREARAAKIEEQQAIAEAALAAEATNKLSKAVEPGSPMEMAMAGQV